MLSRVQLEAVLYALQQHERTLLSALHAVALEEMKSLHSGATESSTPEPDAAAASPGELEARGRLTTRLIEIPMDVSYAEKRWQRLLMIALAMLPNFRALVDGAEAAFPGGVVVEVKCPFGSGAPRAL